jgi:Na+-transporting methylmalonyl-CoA/oxaloacetate decarboxylase gamma subunit
MILRRRYTSAIPIAATILGIFAVSFFGLGITLDNDSLTVIGLVFLVITVLLILILCLMECRRRYNTPVIEQKEEADPTNGMRRNKSDTDLELITGNQKEDRSRMYQEP